MIILGLHLLQWASIVMVITPALVGLTRCICSSVLGQDNEWSIAKLSYNQIAYTFPSFTSYYGSFGPPKALMIVLTSITACLWITGAPTLPSTAPAVQQTINNVLVLLPAIGMPGLSIVSDRGPGLKPSEQHSVFVKFAFGPPIMLALLFYDGPGAIAAKSLIVLIVLVLPWLMKFFFAKAEWFEWMRKAKQIEKLNAYQDGAFLTQDDVANYKLFIKFGGVKQWALVAVLAFILWNVGALSKVGEGPWRQVNVPGWMP